MVAEPFFDEQSERNFEDLVAALRERDDAAVFIGAGLSANRMPSWSELHSGLQEDDRLQPPRQFSALLAPEDFQHFRSELGDDDYLNRVKTLLGQKQPGYPEAYRILDETPGFRCLITTNLDEFLAMRATEHQGDNGLVVYPERQPLGARFVYMHGRAFTANTADDLVLCEPTYAMAYRDGGFADLRLTWNLQRDMLFVGCSLEDPDLRKILKTLSRKRLVGEKEVGRRPFAILDVGPGTSPEDVNVATTRYESNDVRPIWYKHDGDYAELSTVLRKLQRAAQPLGMEDVYLEQTREIDSLSSKVSPDGTDTTRLLRLLDDNPALTNQFLRSASSPAWYDMLLENGVLTAVLEPTPDDEGRIQLRSWAAAPYVARIAPERPEAVAVLTSLLRTTMNWHVQGVLSGLATWLSDEQLHEALPVLQEWRRSEFARTSLIDLNLVTLFAATAAAGLSAAFALLEELLRTQEQGELGGQGMESYHVEQMDAGVQSLIASEPERAYQLMKASLIASLEEYRQGWFSRAAIEDHDQNATQFHPLQHARVAWTRDALIELNREVPEAGGRELDTLNASEEELLVRLVLHNVRSQPELLEKLDSPAITFERVFEHGLFHELMLLLRDRFAALPEDQQDAVHRAVREGPPAIEGDSEGDRQGRLDGWRRRLLRKIPIENQNAEETQWRTELGIIPDDTDESFFLMYSTTAWVAETVDEPDLSAVLAEGIENLLSYLREEPGRWRGLRQLVRDNPQEILGLTIHFEPHDFAKLTYFLEAYGDLAMSDVSFSWGPLIALSERMVAAPQTPGEYHFSAVTRLLRNGLGTAPDVQGVPVDLRERAVDICARVLDQESIPLAVGLPEDRESSSHQLNSAAGEAADALLWYVESETSRSVAGQGIPASVAKYVKVAVDEGWGGLEMRHALGQFAVRLEWFEPGWTEENLNSLFPDGDDLELSLNARRAFVNGYLRRQPTRGMIETLRPMYREVIPDTGREKPLYLDERRLTRSPFLQHVLIGWIWDLEGFGPDGLLGQLQNVADDEALAEIVSFLGSEYANSSDEEHRKKLWRKMDEYWELRVGAAETLERDDTSQELTRFCAWVRNVDVPLSDIEKRLAVCIDHVEVGFGLYLLLEGLTKRAGSEPAEVSRVLEHVVKKWSTSQEFAWSADKLEETVDALCAAADEDEAPILKRIVVKLHQDAGIDFREKLENVDGPSA